MKELFFDYVIPNEYFPEYKVIESYTCRAFYRADSLGNTFLYMIAFNVTMPYLSKWSYAKLIVEIEAAAKDHYNTLGIEEPDFSDIEAQEKYLL